MISRGNMLTRFSRTVSRSLVGSFFTQRHPQAKSSITDRKDGWMDGRQSCTRRDFEEFEFEESISAKFRSFSNSLRDTGRRTQWKKAKNLILVWTSAFIKRLFLFSYVHVLSCWPEQHTNVTKGNLYTMEWFLITCHKASQSIGTRGLRVLRWTGVFFLGGWGGMVTVVVVGRGRVRHG